MIEAVMFWNEPNNKSHWDFEIDPEWNKFRLLDWVDEPVLESELGRYFAHEETFLNFDDIESIVTSTFSFPDDNFDYDGNLDREQELLIDDLI